MTRKKNLKSIMPVLGSFCILHAHASAMTMPFHLVADVPPSETLALSYILNYVERTPNEILNASEEVVNDFLKKMSSRTHDKKSCFIS